MHRNFTPTNHSLFSDKNLRTPGELKDAPHGADKPSKSVISNILNYSRALMVCKTTSTGKIHFILN